MKRVLGPLVLCCMASVAAGAATKVNPDYRDGVLLSFRSENTGTSCSSSGNVNGSVDDSGNVRGTSESSGRCVNVRTYFYRIKVGETELTLRRTFTGGQKAMTVATMGWGALFLKDSVLAGKPPGTKFEIWTGDGKAHVRLGRRESLYSIVGEASAQPEPAPSGTLTTITQSPTAPAVLEVRSTPSGADIEIDGAFVGNTPSEVNVATGEHSVSVSKKGYVTWERRVTVTSGHVNLSPVLDPVTGN